MIDSHIADNLNNELVQAKHEIQALRKALQALVQVGPETHYDTVKHLHGCVVCGGGLNGWGELVIHKPDCPWLAAKQLLEEMR